MNVVPLAQNPDAVQVSFDDFWALFPRRVAKKEALRAWQKIPPELHAKIIAAIAAQKQSDQWREEGGKYIPYPASWLNGERWDDELEGDLSMGECSWNRNGNREPGKQKCASQAVTEKNGITYCAHHARLV